MADELICEREKDLSDSDSCESFQDSEEAPDRLSTSSKQSSLKDPKAISSKVKKDWKRRFRYLSYKDFLVQTRSLISMNDKSIVKDISATDSEKINRRDEEAEGIYADDKGYFRGEIFEELESDDNIGFAGDVCKQLNLLPNMDVSDHEPTTIDDGSLRTDLQTDSFTPEIVVVSSSRFVRELKVEKFNMN